MTEPIVHQFDDAARVVEARSDAPPEAAWALLATPAWWPAWAPHITRVSGDVGGPPPADLAVGQHLRIHGPGPVAVRARITHLDPGRRWDFAVDLPGLWSIVNAHEVEPDGTGARVVVRMRVEGPLCGAISRTALTAYVPLAGYALRRLAWLAEEDHATAETALARLRLGEPEAP
jgi:hypothetical protein